jgi:prophage regulatory protein
VVLLIRLSGKFSKKALNNPAVKFGGQIQVVTDQPPGAAGQWYVASNRPQSEQSETRGRLVHSGLWPQDPTRGSYAGGLVMRGGEESVTERGIMSKPKAQPVIPAEGLVRVSQLLGCRRRGLVPILPISRSGLYAWIRDGRFPAPMKLGKVIAWDAAVVREALAGMKGSAR